MLCVRVPASFRVRVDEFVEGSDFGSVQEFVRFALEGVMEGRDKPSEPVGSSERGVGAQGASRPRVGAPVEREGSPYAAKPFNGPFPKTKERK